MKKQSITHIFAGLMCLVLVSCGGFNAASNSDREDDEPGSRGGNNNGNNTQAISVEEMPAVLNSQIFRDPGTTIYKYSQESEFFRKNTLPTTLNPIPDKQIHDMDAKTIRPNDPVNCGLEFDSGVVTIARRIDDCAAKNKDDVRAHVWKGQINGLAGEGDWRLVAHKNGRSVWMDVATGLVWSSPLAAKSWDYASGNVAENEQICNGANDTEDLDRFLGIQADEVAWRLPTRNDYLQADLNGSRFVLSLVPDETFYWTANYISADSEAWAIQLGTGILKRQSENTMLSIRCVGSVIK